MRSAETTHEGHSRLSWLLAAIALIAGVAAIVLRDDSEAAGISVAAALSSAASATIFIGAPYARAGRPSALRIAALFIMGVGGLALQAAVDWIVAIGIFCVSYAIVILSLARWPPSEREQPSVREAPDRPPFGLPVAVAGTLFAFFAVTGLIAGATDSRGLQLALGAILVVVATQCWLRIRALYVGQGPARSAPTHLRRPGS